MFGYMFTHPGTRLIFMGGEFGQGGEWAFEGQLDWWLLDSPMHKGVQNLVKDLNGLNKNQPAIYDRAFESNGFEWVSYDDTQNSVIAYLRKANDDTNDLLVVCNMTPNVLTGYELGVPKAGEWVEILNTDAAIYGGSNVINEGEFKTIKDKKHNQAQLIRITLAPLSTSVFKRV
jgi:1,4-alpha-glucan branching enzyme